MLLLVCSCVSATFYIRAPGHKFTVATSSDVGHSWKLAKSHDGQAAAYPTQSASNLRPAQAAVITAGSIGSNNLGQSLGQGSVLGNSWETVRSTEGDLIASFGQTSGGDGTLLSRAPAGQVTHIGGTGPVQQEFINVGTRREKIAPEQALSVSQYAGGMSTINEEMEAAIGPRIFRSATIAAPAGTVIAEGDIIWNIKQYNTIQKELRTQWATRRRPRPDPRLVSLWPGGIVPIRISSGGFTRGQKRRMQTAMNRISRDTCVCFRIVTKTQASLGAPHVRIRNRRRCASFIGRNIRRSGRQRYQDLLMAPMCRSTRVFTHQLLHTLGLYHEHTAPDRNRYVRILYRNISPDHWFHMNRIPWVRYSNIQRTTPYDYKSLMHYGPWVFTNNRRITIYPTRNTASNLARVGRSNLMSSLDQRRIRRMYDCPRVPPPRPSCPQYPYRFP
ncbi:Zinc metalloproteinase nas-14 [Mizuhopecten yessoensis]|uniref:Metalloendopeptidase n=2 Tax=Mizuhopecten yessoensis TaxID=6573 RepID=A0A210PIY4_MIZYE|nr:Zinc metalloproteinase nas-14 [Mizuhopecten yessoensis]